jgi:hypothetical protein
VHGTVRTQGRLAVGVLDSGGERGTGPAGRVGGVRWCFAADELYHIYRHDENAGAYTGRTRAKRGSAEEGGELFVF